MVKCKMMYALEKISYFGDEFSHTHAAALKQFPQCCLAGFKTITATLSALSGGGGFAAAVVPLENSIEGTVNESIDNIAAQSLYITKEINLIVHQSLIAKAGAELSFIKTVYSHPQALSQCRGFLQKNLPNAELQAVAYTSAGLKMLTDNTRAAIALSGGGGLQVLSQNIEDSDTNTTRFVVVKAKPRLEGGKASVMVTTRDEAGALLKVLKVLYDNGISMTKLESRPLKTRLGGYNFFIDFNFGGCLNKLLEQLQEQCTVLKFLGSY